MGPGGLEARGDAGVATGVSCSGRDKDQHFLIHNPHSNKLCKAQVLGTSLAANSAYLAIKPDLVWGAQLFYFIYTYCWRIKDGSEHKVQPETLLRCYEPIAGLVFSKVCAWYFSTVLGFKTSQKTHARTCRSPPCLWPSQESVRTGGDTGGRSEPQKVWQALLEVVTPPAQTQMPPSTASFWHWDHPKPHHRA